MTLTRRITIRRYQDQRVQSFEQVRIQTVQLVGTRIFSSLQFTRTTKSHIPEGWRRYIYIYTEYLQHMSYNISPDGSKDLWNRPGTLHRTVPCHSRHLCDTRSTMNVDQAPPLIG